MKKIWMGILLALAVAVPVSAYTIPPGLAASQVIVQHGATAIVDVAQTGGSPTTLKTVSTCYAGAAFAGTQTFSWLGSATLTFNNGPRRFKGSNLTPDHCWVQTYYQISGNLIVVLADNTDTLP